MGEVAGKTLAGAEAAWSVAPGFWSTIGERTLKYVGWGDGWDERRFEPGEEGAFACWYGKDGELVGVVAHLERRRLRTRPRDDRGAGTVELSAATTETLPPPAATVRAVVVVPAHDEEERIGACLAALAGQVEVAPRGIRGDRRPRRLRGRHRRRGRGRRRPLPAPRPPHDRGPRPRRRRGPRGGHGRRLRAARIPGSRATACSPRPTPIRASRRTGSPASWRRSRRAPRRSAAR